MSGTSTRSAPARTGSGVSVGPLLRSWRERRRLSQLDLAGIAGVTTRHLSFVETGRSRPSREMVLHLAECLEVPLRERNRLLVAAGFAPTFREGDFDDPSFDSVRAALERILNGHEPYPAVVVDRQWQLVAANEAAMVLIEDVDPELMEPPVNVLRTALHPKGLAPRIENLEQWSDHIIGRLRRQALITGDEDLVDLAEELDGYVTEVLGTSDRRPSFGEGPEEVALPVLFESRKGTLSLITTIATFGTALDITLAELALEAFLPADDETMRILNEYAAERSVA
jgi:transcriptional regulator with XRE-family HTH domain